MKNNKCQIINDLLPNYVSNLTSDETNEFIRNHLKDCTTCQHIYEKMQKNINFNDKKYEEIQITGFKKIHRKFKVFEITIIILLFTLLIGATFYWNYWKNGYLGAAETLIDVTNSLDTIDAFYATIEEISDTELYDNSKILTIKGLEINSQNHQEQYKIFVPASTTKILWNNTEVKTSDLKIGQTILIISLGETISNKTLENTEIMKIEILDAKI